MNIDLMYTILFSIALMVIIAVAYTLNKTRGVLEQTQTQDKE